ncbi:hypothetical protein [Sphingomonas sp. BK345]|uniref:hypothetical protein n=1 Tax=Sphingomonas sp. BK345 TaxID=2586980 RepID=UPI0016167687|nr:hypothetical protein [Sphingomonas sp. BK345]MBB3475890.1 hypothetical protein [Sphingomonas sp. BK345]
MADRRAGPRRGVAGDRERDRVSVTGEEISDESPDSDIESRKRRFALKVGGVGLVGALWAVNVQYVAAWASPTLYFFALIGLSVVLHEGYEVYVLGEKRSRASMITIIIVTTAFILAAFSDSILRQNYRQADCLRFEREIVTAAPGNRADAANAFQALRCMPSGGIFERLAGPSVKLEATLRKANEDKAAQKTADRPTGGR